ncbi:MAG: putative repeat protein (TIGR01451 family) [Candidatus Nitrosomirales archaeon]|jgi:uncharacterized repeat protein (TIGR01451 family)
MLDQENVGVGASMLQARSIRFSTRRNGIFNAILGLTLAALLFLGGLPLFALTQAHASSDQTVIIPADKDSFLRQNAKDNNEGGNDMLRVQKTGKNRIIVGFNQDAIVSAIGDRTLESARLRLHIIDTGINWGLGGNIELHKLLADWAEGNGWNAGNYDPFRGTVLGSTWNCAIDTAIWSYYPECSSLWDGGIYGEPTDSVTITNNLSGVIEFDVTNDVNDFLSNGYNFGWLVKKTDEFQSGTVVFASRENGAINGPELILETAVVEAEEVSLISDVAIDPVANDTSVVIEADSTNNEAVTEPFETSSPIDSEAVSDMVTSLPDAEASAVIEQMSNSTIADSTTLGLVNPTIAIPETDVTQSNSTDIIEPISLLQPVALPEPESDYASTEVSTAPSDITTENNYLLEQINSTTIVIESSVTMPNSTLTDPEALPEPFSNSTLAAAEQIVQSSNSTAILESVVLPEPIDSTAEVSSNNPIPSAAPEHTEVISFLAPAADLVIGENNDFDWVIAGEMYAYTITVTNNGPSEATNIVVTNTLPAGVTFTASSASQGTCSESENLVTCGLGKISPESYATIAIVVTVSSYVQASSLTNSASVTSDTPDLDKDNNSVTGTINVTTQSDLSIVIEGSSESAVAGQELAYNIMVTNDGPSDAANVVAIDALPEGVTLSTSTSSQGTCSLIDNVVTCNLGTIATDGSATIAIVATVNPDVPTDVTSSASVTSDTDRYAGPDTDSATARYIGPDTDNNSRKIVLVEMTKTEDGLSANVDIGDIAADQKAELLLLNNTLPDAQLNAIEITPTSNVTDVGFNITLSKDLPENLPPPIIDDPLLFIQVSLNASGVDFSDSSTYSTSPEITFTVDKNEDGTCKDVELYMLNEETGEWETESLSISQVEDMGSYCMYKGTVPHFSTFMIGLKKPTGGGGVGSGGSGGGGGPAVMGVENPKTVYNYSDDDDDDVAVNQARSAVQYKFATSAVGGVDSKNDTMEVSTINGKGVISTYSDTIVIKNKSNSTLQSVRVTLSPEISKSFHLDKYAIKSIEPNSEVTLGIKLRGNPNRDTDGRVTGFSGSVIVQAANHSPLMLPVKINSLDNSYYEINMEKVAQISQQRYNKISLVNKILNNGLTEKSDIDVTTRKGLKVIGTPSDQIVIKNLSDRTLNNVRVMVSKASNAFLLDKYSIVQIEPNGEAVLQMIPRLDMNKYAPRDFRAEIVIAPENGIPRTISVNIPAVERGNSADEYEVKTLSDNNELTKAVDRMTIKNTADRTMDSVKLMLPSGMDRILQLSEDSFKTIGSNETVTVDLKFRSTIGEKKEAFMQDYNGELTIVSEHHNQSTIPLRIEWNEVSNEHFEVYARSGDESIAKQVADLLEGNYKQITSRFGEMNAKTVIYMASSTDEMKLINTSGHPYYSYTDDVIFVCSCDDPKYNSLKEFVYRLIVNNYPTYHNVKKLMNDKENWLVDGIAAYVAASIIGGSEKYLEAFANDRVDLQWFGYGSDAQYGAVFAFLDFLDTKYGDAVIDKSLEFLGSTMISNHRCSTLEQCAVLRAAYDVSSLDMNDKKHSLAFDTLVNEWSSHIEIAE